MSELSWGHARSVAAAVPPLPVAPVLLAEAAGLVLAEPVPARCDLPPFDASAMDGWAVRDQGPWRLRRGQPGGESRRGDEHGGEHRGLAGSITPPLGPGEATPIATGARLPDRTTAVLRREHGSIGPDGLLAGEVEPGRDIRHRGQECRSGDELMPAGAVVTPAMLGLAAAAGYDELPVIRRARVGLYVLGDELLASGLPRDGRVRDALGPLLPGWLRAFGAEVDGARYVKDTVQSLSAALAASTADVVVTTGGTARGPVDHVHTALAAAGATLLVDGAQVRPGHPMLFARLAPARFLVGLPGNPLAAVSGVLTLLEPLVRALHGLPPATLPAVRLAAPVTGHPQDNRLVPVRQGVPLHFSGPGMLRGFALADGMAVIPPGGALAGAEVELLPLPWAPPPRQ